MSENSQPDVPPQVGVAAALLRNPLVWFLLGAFLVLLVSAGRGVFVFFRGSSVTPAVWTAPAPMAAPTGSTGVALLARATTLLHGLRSPVTRVVYPLGALAAFNTLIALVTVARGFPHGIGGWVRMLLSPARRRKLTAAARKNPRLAFGAVLPTLGQRLSILQSKVGLPLLLVGAGSTLFALWGTPSLLLLATGFVYGIFLVIELLLSHSVQRLFGQVQEATTGRPIVRAHVELLGAEADTVYARCLTSWRGLFILVLPAGTYRLRATASLYAPHESHLVIAQDSRLGKIDLHLPPAPPSRRALPPTDQSVSEM